MKFSTVNSQNRHLACLEARFLPRNLFHFYKKSPHPVRDTPFSPVFPVSLPHPPSCPSNPVHDTLFSPKFPVSLQRSTALRSNPVRDTPFSADFPVSLPHFPYFPSYPIRDTLFSPKFPVSRHLRPTSSYPCCPVTPSSSDTSRTHVLPKCGTRFL